MKNERNGIVLLSEKEEIFMEKINAKFEGHIKPF